MMLNALDACKSHLLEQALLTLARCPGVLTRACTAPLFSWSNLRFKVPSKSSVGTLSQAGFLTCNTGLFPLGVTLPSASESSFLSEPSFSARWQGRPVQPLPGRGVRGQHYTQQVSVALVTQRINPEWHHSAEPACLSKRKWSRVAESCPSPISNVERWSDTDISE